MIGDPFFALEQPELAYRWRFTGTHPRPGEPARLAATGRRVEVDGTSILHSRDGQALAVDLSFDTTTVAGHGRGGVRRLFANPPIRLAPAAPKARVTIVG